MSPVEGSDLGGELFNLVQMGLRVSFAVGESDLVGVNVYDLVEMVVRECFEGCVSDLVEMDLRDCFEDCGSDWAKMDLRVFVDAGLEGAGFFAG